MRDINSVGAKTEASGHFGGQYGLMIKNVTDQDRANFRRKPWYFLADDAMKNMSQVKPKVEVK